MADPRPQPIPGVVLTSKELDFWATIPADVQAKIIAAPDRAAMPGVIDTWEFMGIHSWADVKTNSQSQIGPFQFYGIPGLQQGAQAANAAGSAISSTADFLGKLGDPHTWVRIVMVAVGAALIVTAASMLTRDAGLTPKGNRP